MFGPHKRGCIVAFSLFLCLVPTGNATPDETQVVAGAEKPAAGDLVRSVIAEEKKIKDVLSLHLRFKCKWTRTSEGIAIARARLEKRIPAVEITEDQFADIPPDRSDEIELAFDSSRVYYLFHAKDSSIDLIIWDGQRAVARYTRLPNNQESYFFDSSPEPLLAEAFFRELTWPRMEPHSLWWSKQTWTKEQLEMGFGDPDGFSLIGEHDYRGRRCFVLENRNIQERLYIGVDDRRLYGRAHVWLAMDKTGELAILNRVTGRTFQSVEEGQEWIAGLPSDESERNRTSQFNAAFDEFSRTNSEQYLDDYREVADGLWVPAKQGYVVDQILLAEKRCVILARRDLELVEAKANSELPNSLFAIGTIPDGADVTDLSHDPQISYKQKANRTAEEWQEIIDQHKRDNEEWRKQEAARQSLVGTAAPALPISTWINSEPLNWDDLRGKVIVLHFWAYWCAPCHNDLESLNGLNKSATKVGLIVIGVHNPGSELADIKADIKRHEMAYPILIDVPRSDGPERWGRLFHQFRGTGIPLAVVVDREGRVAAIGKLDQVLSKAIDLQSGRD